ncbi:uncharacterized protein FOMMEDRAFT_17249, partial [Fomitiporia mediterranea MF3/22]|uniref:uncharacterized protein n=1 Tax=Fomitiporia mediterranea (strain MF3/22) TaxID=694068 RepID=UPI0004409934
MPTVRNIPAPCRATSYQTRGDSEYTTPPRPSSYRASASPTTKSPKKKKPSNAFFLYRSYVIANGLLPDDVKHQNDASRMAALMWKGESAEVRMKFFAEAEKKKEEQKKEDRELTLTPSTPTLSSPSTSSFPNSSRASSPATPRTPYSPFVQTPTTPKGFTPRFPDFLPQSPSPSRPSQPSRHLERTLKHESFP